MTNDEIKRAMKEKLAVEYNGIEYAFIYEYVLRFDAHGKQQLHVGLMDKNMNCIVRANLDKVRLVPCN